MIITYFSFIMTIIWSSALIMLFYIGLRKRCFIKYFGVSNLVIIYVICTIRLLAPVELPFVKVMGLRGIFADVYEFIHLNTITKFNANIRITDLLVSIWLIGTLIVLVRWGVEYRRAIKKICSLMKVRNKQCEKMLIKVQSNFRQKIQVEIWQSSNVDVPMGIGVIRKYIIIPDIPYTDNQLYYILLHEYTHFVNRDISVKVLVHIFSCIFWWNPCVYLLKKELDQALEIKCDLTVTESLDRDSKVSYLEVIVAMIKNVRAESERKYLKPAAMLVQAENEVAIIERFQIVMDEHLTPRKVKLSYYVWVIFLCGLIGFSYLFQFQAEFPAPPLTAGEEITPDNTYIIDNGDGTYIIVDLYGRCEDTHINKQWIIDDLKLKGFSVELERKNE